MAAFAALGGEQGPAYWHELAAVGSVLRECGDPLVDELLASLPSDLETHDRVVAIAEAAGANAFVALDLVTEYNNPDAPKGLRAVAADGGEQ
jgi:hypothetical protein